MYVSVLLKKEKEKKKSSRIPSLQALARVELAEDRCQCGSRSPATLRPPFLPDRHRSDDRRRCKQASPLGDTFEGLQDSPCPAHGCDGDQQYDLRIKSMVLVRLIAMKL